MSKTYSPQEIAVLSYLESYSEGIDFQIAVLSYLESYSEGIDFMGLREHFLAIYEKELLSPTLTSLVEKRFTTSRLHEKALWMEITEEGLAALRAL